MPLAQERPFLIFYLGGMYEWALFQIWIMSFKTARLPFPTPLRKMMLWIRQKRTYFDRQNDDLKDAEKFLKEWQKVVSERLTENDREKAEKSKVLRLQEFEQLRQDDIRIHTGDLAGQRLVDVLVSDLMETAA